MTNGTAASQRRIASSATEAMGKASTTTLMRCSSRGSRNIMSKGLIATDDKDHHGLPEAVDLGTPRDIRKAGDPNWGTTHLGWIFVDGFRIRPRPTGRLKRLLYEGESNRRALAARKDVR